MSRPKSVSTVRWRLGTAFGAALLCALLILGASLFAIRSITKAYDSVTENDVADLEATHKLLSAIERSSIYFRGYLLLGDEESLHRNNALRSEVDDHLRDVERLTKSSKGKELLKGVRELLDRTRVQVDETIQMARAHPRIPKAKLIERFEKEVLPIGTALRARLDELINHKEEQVHAAEDEMRRKAFIGNSLVILIAAIALFLTGLLAILITRTLANLYSRLEESLAEQNRLTEELKRTNEDLERFASVASHDLQEPLRTISTFLQLLEQQFEKTLNKEAKEYIHFAVDASYRLKALISALLTYSRTRHWPLNPEKVSTDEILRAVLLNLKNAIDESGATFNIGNLPSVEADPIQLTQLFQNLIGNAIKFRGTAAPKIEISASPLDSLWLFSIRDNGIGFETSNAGKIFEEFGRLHSRSNYPGTGLGLSVCKKIVERHGGKIWAKSQPNQGSVFYFTLPRVLAAPTPIDIPA